MASRRNYLVFDIETSGRNFDQGHEIVQLSAKAYNIYNLEPSDAGIFNVYIKPKNPDKADPTALNIIGDVWDKALKEGLEPSVAYQSFLEYLEKVNPENKWIKKPTLVGFNIQSFDVPFLTKSMIKYKALEEKDDGEIDFPWSIINIDLMHVVMSLFDTDYELDNFKLDSVLDKFNIKRSSDKHDALEDVHLTGEVFVRTMRFLRAARKRMVVSNG